MVYQVTTELANVMSGKQPRPPLNKAIKGGTKKVQVAKKSLASKAVSASSKTAKSVSKGAKPTVGAKSKGNPMVKAAASGSIKGRAAGAMATKAGQGTPKTVKSSGAAKRSPKAVPTGKNTKGGPGRMAALAKPTRAVGGKSK
jgi:hypothetical protein